MLKNHPHLPRYPAQIISHAVWLYHRFTLSFRDIEDILAARGVIVSYETIRQWCLKITSPITRQLKKKQGQLGDEWYLDEVFIKLNGKAHYLWSAVDQDGCELDVFVSKRRNKKAALRDMGVKIKHNTRQYTNNIAEISHQKIRQQQRQMRNFKTVKHAQKFLANHSLINNLFRHQRHLAKASSYRLLREESFNTWTQTS
ncbi:MAG: IS6 family transposase [Gammaproteobacteria bacterium]|nr:IS6 family transposase [Gammaproteobacteria bacterium]